MHFWLFVFSFVLLGLNASAQRVYAPEVTGSGHVKYESETLVFMLTPDKIQKLETSEHQVHIQMTQGAREYFYTLTRLNVGKKMVIKSGGGETIQEAIIRKPIDSGIIISKPVKESRGALARFLQRIKTGKEPIEIQQREEYTPPIEDYFSTKKLYNTQEAKSQIVNDLEGELADKDKEIMELRKKLLELQDFEERVINLAPGSVEFIEAE